MRGGAAARAGGGGGGGARSSMTWMMNSGGWPSESMADTPTDRTNERKRKQSKIEDGQYISARD